MVKGNFGRFLDLQTAIRELAYPTIGIAALTEAVMGTAPKKSKKVTMSNWEKYMLNPYQILYGSWDVFMCGLVLRQLRHWHAVGMECTSCGQNLGQRCEQPIRLTCPCGKEAASLHSLWSHCKTKGHDTVHQCDLCKRIVFG
ncbi:unnamed protein product [Ostreobium quekettii]|uniref:Uncharacterized protein n=1 Tax=Ostreobium quekettii TaxID=121088 RepID=A0A8S1J9R2_9CHLO|nr:unnamed protein product [Ostreobium quekettii]